MPENTRYMVHMLKNEMAKQRLSVQFIRELEIPETRDELNILRDPLSILKSLRRRARPIQGKFI